MTITDTPTLLVALATLIVSAVAAAMAVRGHQSSREAFIRQMRSDWTDLQTSWGRILVAIYGPDFHYFDLDEKEIPSAAELYDKLRESDGLEPGYSAARVLRRDVRPVTRFLAYAADSVIRGRWRMHEAYEVFGPDVARHHQVLRILSHRTDGVQEWVEQATEFNTFDEQDCILLFAFLLRAEQCRRGDTYAHFAIELAHEMRGSHREELSDCVRRVARVRRRPVPSNVRWLLWRGRHPRLSGADVKLGGVIAAGLDELDVYRMPLEPKSIFGLRIRRVASHHLEDGHVAATGLDDGAGSGLLGD